MNHSRIRHDLERLANALPHRAANTENERAAAQYLLERFREHTPDVEMDEFYSPEAPTYLFASYYAEFLVVAVLNCWFPWVALIYGMGVFLAYIAEFNGFALLSRFMPQFETQNVVARFLGTKPQKLIVVSANYDTGVSTPLAQARVLPWLRTGHTVLLAAMVVVIVTCGLKATGGEDTALYAGAAIARNIALGILVAGGGVLVYSDLTGEHTRGAVNNAAGVAALLALAEELQTDPIENADVWFVATGSKESWMDGMRHLIASHKFDRNSTYFINIASAGAGNLRYITGEGMLHLYRSPRELVEMAKDLAPQFGASPLSYRSYPTDALAPLTRGYRALSLMATGDQDVPPHVGSLLDNVTQVDCAKIEEMARFAGALVRKLEAATIPHVIEASGS